MKANAWLHPRFTVGESDGSLFGGFIEHMGHAVYGGIYEPGHPAADEEGFRTDVLGLVRDLQMPFVRYPGGNFVSAYDWRTGVGPRAKRKPHRDPVWNAVESNEFALDEFMRWCKKAGTAPMLVMNLGTGSPAQALELYDYCCGTSGSGWSGKRKAFGSENPYPVHYWCLGNEMSSPRQPGWKPAHEYARAAAETARQLKEKDSSLELIVSGSSCRNAAYFGFWDMEVLSGTFDWADQISLHAYFGPKGNDLPGYLAGSDRILDRHIREVAAICDTVAAQKKSGRRIGLALDEWNVWSGTNRSDIKFTVEEFEDIYTALDAVVLGGLLITMLNHADRLQSACLAQTCNILAPIMTQPGGTAWRQSIYHPFALTSRYGRGTVMQVRLSAPDLPGTGIPCLNAAAVCRKETAEISLFLLNRHWTEPVDLKLELTGFEPQEIRSALVMAADDQDAVNSPESENVQPVELKDCILTDNQLLVKCPLRSWSMIRIGSNRLDSETGNTGK
ncbi:MAG: alpha-N-arabinofuranosidase [Lentisphaeria bacterium]|nr:alpha-N-arabinofuranosidase [Lentisphaeria bacterium]